MNFFELINTLISSDSFELPVCLIAAQVVLYLFGIFLLYFSKPDNTASYFYYRNVYESHRLTVRCIILSFVSFLVATLIGLIPISQKNINIESSHQYDVKVEKVEVVDNNLHLSFKDNKNQNNSLLSLNFDSNKVTVDGKAVTDQEGQRLKNIYLDSENKIKENKANIFINLTKTRRAQINYRLGLFGILFEKHKLEYKSDKEDVKSVNINITDKHQSYSVDTK